MSDLLLLLIIALSVAVGCYVGQKHLFQLRNYQPPFSKDYFTGLNYLLNEQADKAADVFTRLLHADSDTVETHLALGSLFRKRGEIGRAIKIHQNLIARPQLPKQYRVAALFALGKDYLQAGLIDRAEKLFLEITSTGDEPLMSLHYLLAIYQQQKNWQSAIKVAEQLKSMTDEPLAMTIAHYHCELAQTHIQKHETNSAIQELKLALKQDPKCVRANLLLGKLFFDTGKYKNAIAAIEDVLFQDKMFFSEGLKTLVSAYKALHQDKQCIEFLKTSDINIDVTLFLTHHYQETEGDEKAMAYLTQYLQKRPSLKGLQYLIEFKNQQNDLIILKDIIKNIIKTIPHYRCVQCGFKSNQLIWLCPGCKRWNEIKPVAY